MIQLRKRNAEDCAGIEEVLDSEIFNFDTNAAGCAAAFKSFPWTSISPKTSYSLGLNALTQ